MAKLLRVAALTAFGISLGVASAQGTGGGGGVPSGGGTGSGCVTTGTGVQKGNGSGGCTAATSGTDYVVPSGSITGSAGTITGVQPASRVTGLATSATIDTTNAANITSGTVPSARQPSLTSGPNNNYGLPVQLIRPATTNPTSTLYESSVIVNSDGSCDRWSDYGVSTVAYQHATDAACAVYSAPTPVTGVAYSKGPYVRKVGSTYYMMVSGTPGTPNTWGDIYLFSSTNGTAWTAANGGTAVFTRSAGTYATIFNPAFDVAANGTTAWMLIDTVNGDGYSFCTTFPTCNFNTNASATKVIGRGDFTSAPYLQYVPNRNALFTLYSDGDPAAGSPTLQGDYIVLTGNDNTLPQTPANWKRAPGFSLNTPNIFLSDPTMAFSSNAANSFQTLLAYSYAQNQEYQAYGSLSMDDFYDAITAPANSQPSVLSNSITNQVQPTVYGDQTLSKSWTNPGITIGAAGTPASVGNVSTLPAGAICDIKHWNSGTNYSASATCLTATNDTYTIYVSSANALGSESYTQAFTTTSGSASLPKPTSVTGLAPAVASIGGATTLTTSQNGARIDASGAAFTVNLPGGPTNGQLFLLQKVDATTNTVTISGNGNNINGATTYTLSVPFQSVILQYSPVSGWMVMAGNTGANRFSQIIGTGTAPTIANGAAAGTAPGTATITGTNMSGVITITTGTATTTGTLATITFNGTLPVAPQGCSIQARTAATSPTATATYTTAPTTTTWTIGASSALTASTAYSWYYGPCI